MSSHVRAAMVVNRTDGWVACIGLATLIYMMFAGSHGVRGVRARQLQPERRRLVRWG